MDGARELRRAERGIRLASDAHGSALVEHRRRAREHLIAGTADREVFRPSVKAEIQRRTVSRRDEQRLPAYDVGAGRAGPLILEADVLSVEPPHPQDLVRAGSRRPERFARTGQRSGEGDLPSVLIGWPLLDCFPLSAVRNVQTIAAADDEQLTVRCVARLARVEER